MSQESRVSKQFGKIEARRSAPVSQALTGTGALGALSQAAQVHVISTTGASTGTLSYGAQVGQEKLIIMKVDGGDFVLTPISIVGGTTLTFSAVGQYHRLVWTGATWNPVGGSAALA